MSGLTRMRDPRARVCRSRGNRLDAFELARRLDVDRLEAEIDRRSSSSAGVLPTPVKTICAGMKPARSATSISPPELASARLPRPRSSRVIASVELALSA